MSLVQQNDVQKRKKRLRRQLEMQTKKLSKVYSHTLSVESRRNSSAVCSGRNYKYEQSEHWTSLTMYMCRRAKVTECTLLVGAICVAKILHDT